MERARRPDPVGPALEDLTHPAPAPSGLAAWCKLGSMRGHRRAGWVTTLLLVAAMLGLLAHVCVVPLHAHAVPVDGRGSHDEDSADHSVHTASCEAAKGGLTIAAAMPVVQSAELAVAPVASFRQLGPSLDAPTSESPPLFLLHASLLI